MVFVSVLLGVLIVVANAGIALGRSTGEPVLHQLPTVLRSARQGKGTQTWLRPLPLLGPTTNPKQLPPPLARQELLSIDPSAFGVDLQGPVAIIRERRAGLYAITVPKAISERMGHSEIGVTMNVYGHLFEGTQHHLTAELDDLVTRSKAE